jgi:hypothetical protein
MRRRPAGHNKGRNAAAYDQKIASMRMSKSLEMDF